MEQYVTYRGGVRMDEEIRRQFICLLEEAFPPHERRERSGQLALIEEALYQIRTLQENGKLIGFAAVWMLDGMIFLEHFAVDARMRSLGIGGRMLDELKKEAEACGRNLILSAARDRRE